MVQRHLDALCCYKTSSHEYFGRFSIRAMMYVAIFLMAFTQLFIGIFYVTNRVWPWFTGIVACVIGVCLLVYATIKRFGLLLKVMLVYQLLFSLVFFGASISLFIHLCNPNGDSYLRRCVAPLEPGSSQQDYDNYCINRTRTLSGIFFPIFAFFGVVNLFCLVVIWNFMRFCNRRNAPAYQPNPTIRNQWSAPTRPAGVPPSAMTPPASSATPTAGTGGVTTLSASKLGETATASGTSETSFTAQQRSQWGDTGYTGQASPIGQGYTTPYGRYIPGSLHAPPMQMETGYLPNSIHAPPLSPSQENWDAQPQYQNTGVEQTAANNHLYDTTPNW